MITLAPGDDGLYRESITTWLDRCAMEGVPHKDGEYADWDAFYADVPLPVNPLASAVLPLLGFVAGGVKGPVVLCRSRCDPREGPPGLVTMTSKEVHHVIELVNSAGYPVYRASDHQ